MSDDYAMGDKRKSKNDKKAKRKYNVYKKGGKWRSEKAKKKQKKEDE